MAFFLADVPNVNYLTVEHFLYLYTILFIRYINLMHFFGKFTQKLQSYLLSH